MLRCCRGAGGRRPFVKFLDLRWHYGSITTEYRWEIYDRLVDDAMEYMANLDIMQVPDGYIRRVSVNIYSMQATTQDFEVTGAYIDENENTPVVGLVNTNGTLLDLEEIWITRAYIFDGPYGMMDYCVQALDGEAAPPPSPDNRDVLFCEERTAPFDITCPRSQISGAVSRVVATDCYPSGSTEAPECCNQAP